MLDARSEIKGINTRNEILATENEVIDPRNIFWYSRRGVARAKVGPGRVLEGTYYTTKLNYIYVRKCW